MRRWRKPSYCRRRRIQRRLYAETRRSAYSCRPARDRLPMPLPNASSKVPTKSPARSLVRTGASGLFL